MYDLIDRLAGIKWLTSLNLKDGFYHVRVAVSSIEYNAFSTAKGQYTEKPKFKTFARLHFNLGKNVL